MIAAMFRRLGCAGRVRPPIPRQQLIDRMGRMRGDAGQDVSQPGLRIAIVQFGINSDQY
jgi:hypothetical protein